MLGQLCTVGELPNIKRVFYYFTRGSLFIELIDRRNKDMKHLVRLVDAEGKEVSIPPGSRFEHVSSEFGSNLLENYVRKLPQFHAEQAA